MNLAIDAHAAALNAVGSWIKSVFPSARVLTPEDLEKFDRFSEGWELPGPVKEVPFQWLVLSDEFPYSMPRIIIRGNAESLCWPHVEGNGLLCLAGDGAAVSTLEPISVVQNVLHEAKSLLEENSLGLNAEDFQEDFKAYWRRAAKPNQQEFRLILQREGASRLVSAWHGDQFYLVAEDSQGVLRWMEHRFGASDTRMTHSAALIWLNLLPSPAQYPSSCNELRRLIASNSDDGLSIFEHLITSEPSQAAVVLMGTSPGGKTESFGVRIQRPPRVSLGNKRGPYPYAKGFRPGKIPPNILSRYYLFDKANVDDADASSTRMTPALRTLINRKVTVIGCGSLGSSIAYSLAKSGVGSLHLIDPDSLGWENICRHELGANFVGKNKASSLATQIKADIPQVKQCTYTDLNWLKAYAKNDQLFDDSNLIISVTGDWNSESALNDIFLAGGISCPILYGWMEAQAGAAHGVLIGDKEKGCLRCGFDNTGSPLVSAILWSASPAVQHCGGGTSIYGAIELSQAAALISQLAVDALLGKTSMHVWRSWIASKIEIYSNGGLWNPKWTKLYGAPGNGGYVTANPWLIRNNCICQSVNK